ncbi:MAG: hypothetical protein FWG98_05410 [Candidatus Cloacimonetes bacterium]|nr:hypothetical protein [Candidatus Cloacimonadota bacterium]
MKKKIIELLTKELGYSDYVAEQTANDLLSINHKLQPLLEKWLGTREIKNFEILGFSIDELMSQRNFTFPSALIAMDWLLTEPEIATRELSQKYRKVTV